MTIRKKIITTITFTFIGLIVILYFISQSILADRFSDLEQENVRQNVERTLATLHNDLYALDVMAKDWASWDDTYTFIEDANPAYIQKNLVVETFMILRLNFMLFINSSGQLVFGKSFNLRNEEEMVISPSLKGYLSASNLLVHHTDTESKVAGLILLPEGPALVTSRPILTSNNEGPIRGALVMGRYLDGNEIERWEKITLLSLSAYRIDDPQMPADFQAARSSLSVTSPILVKPLDTQHVTGYALITDIYGKPVLVIGVTIPRDIYLQGKASTAYLVLSIVIVGLALGGTTMWLLEEQVLSRLARLTGNVSRIGTSSDLSIRVPVEGRDEFSRLADTINAMMEALELSSKLLQEKNEKLDAQNEELQSQAEQLQNEITERRRMEETLRESEERYRAIFEQAGDSIVLIDEETAVILEFNDRACENLGYSREELARLTIVDIAAFESAEEIKKRIEKNIKEGKNVFETHHKTKGGEIRDVEVSSRIIYIGGGTFALSVWRDITERKWMERELQKRNDELQSQAEEMIAQQQELIEKTREVEEATRLKSEFLANMSHELRTPLNAIIGFSELMIDEVPGNINGEQRQCLSDILNSGQHLLDLINEVLDLSKIESGRMELKIENVALTGVIEMIRSTMMPIINSRKQSLEVKVEGELPPVRADEAKVRQVLLNLVGNSSKFTPNGGKLKIEATRDGDWCRISVVDNGIGIKKEDQERIFEPFCQLYNPLHTEKSGTGLGLTLVKQIVEGYGGRIRVESEYGTGSRFTFTLPLATTDQPL